MTATEVDPRILTDRELELAITEAQLRLSQLLREREARAEPADFSRGEEWNW